MRVYVSNYSSRRGRPAVQISKTSPSWAVIKKSIPELFPSWDLIQLIKTTKVGSRERREAELEYVKRYTRQLIINRDSIFDQLENDDVLCCWCKKGDFCHRLIVAEFLRMNAVECEEI